MSDWLVFSSPEKVAPRLRNDEGDVLCSSSLILLPPSPSPNMSGDGKL